MSTTGPNTPDQLDLVQQMNKLLQDQNKILQQISGAMGAQANAAQKLTESKNAKKTINESRTGYSNRSLQSGQAPRNSGVELDRWAVLAGIRK